MKVVVLPRFFMKCNIVKLFTLNFPKRETMNKTDKTIAIIFFALFAMAMVGLGAGIDLLYYIPMLGIMIIFTLVVYHQFIGKPKK